MTTKEELNEFIEMFGLDNSLTLSEVETITAIIGYDANSGAIIYDYNKLVESFMRHFNNGEEVSGTSEEMENQYIEAVDWIDYNTLRALPYKNEDYVAYDKDGNEVARFDAFKDGSHDKAVEAAGEGGRVDVITYVNPIIMHNCEDW